MPTVILCRPLHPSGMALLEARGNVTVRTLNRPSQSDLAAAMPGAHAVLVGLEEVDEALLSQSPIYASSPASAWDTTRLTLRPARVAVLWSA